MVTRILIQHFCLSSLLCEFFSTASLSPKSNALLPCGFFITYLPFARRTVIFLFIIIVISFFHNVMPLFVGNIDIKHITGLMIFYSILKFLWHHFFSKKPTCVAMCGVSIHRKLIGKLRE